MRWRKCDDIPVNGIECLCKCRKLTGEIILRILIPYVYRDESGTAKIYDWYDENECYGQWRLNDVLGWYPLARLEKELDEGEDEQWLNTNTN